MAGDEDEVRRDDTTEALLTADLRLAEFLKGDPPLPHALLLVVSGDQRGEILTMDNSPAIVGRVADADVMIDDTTVSRRHAILRHGPDGLEVEDLGSSNGTTMNGNPMTGSFHLIDGDLVGFGSATVLVKRIA
ncbi:MAG TPA: FHA domain-containing protein [Acidimicrobiales bacterium]|nr:FHA domain-containing protein [Acidimicrobiales bacterium]